MKIRFWSKKINQLFNTWHKSEDALLCITGDIDNLGVYVATSGRAQAENLVEMINHILGNLLSKNLSNKNIVYIPSGEEVIIMSLGERSVLQKGSLLFDKKEVSSINHKIKDELALYGYPQYIGISFGVKIFGKEELAPLVDTFLSSEKISFKNNAYFSLLLKIRSDLAHELDKQKFMDILENNHTLNEVYLRNLVYKEMLNYKENSRRKILEEKLNFDVERKPQIYGINQQGIF